MGHKCFLTLMARRPDFTFLLLSGFLLPKGSLFILGYESNHIMILPTNLSIFLFIAFIVTFLFVEIFDCVRYEPRLLSLLTDEGYGVEVYFARQHLHVHVISSSGKKSAFTNQNMFEFRERRYSKLINIIIANITNDKHQVVFRGSFFFEFTYNAK